jgi:hypothetical protein
MARDTRLDHTDIDTDIDTDLRHTRPLPHSGSARNLALAEDSNLQFTRPLSEHGLDSESGSFAAAAAAAVRPGGGGGGGQGMTEVLMLREAQKLVLMRGQMKGLKEGHDTHAQVNGQVAEVMKLADIEALKQADMVMMQIEAQKMMEKKGLKKAQKMMGKEGLKEGCSSEGVVGDWERRSGAPRSAPASCECKGEVGGGEGGGGGCGGKGGGSVFGVSVTQLEVSSRTADRQTEREREREREEVAISGSGSNEGRGNAGGELREGEGGSVLRGSVTQLEDLMTFLRKKKERLDLAIAQKAHILKSTFYSDFV